MTKFLPPHLPHLGDKYYRRGKTIPKNFYRITVKGIAMNSKGQILVLKEARYGDRKSKFYREDGGLYDFPGGGISWGEDFRAALSREIQEEMCISQKNFEIGEEPLYVQVSELDDRYYDDPEKDDFYPALMMYYPVRFYSLDFIASEECVDVRWVGVDDIKSLQMWTHSGNLRNIFQKKDFPKAFIS